MKSKTFNLSIAIPVFNGGIFLDKNLKRFVTECNNQKFKNLFEIIISDNASTDNTNNIVKKYQKILSKKKFVKIKYVRNQKNLGYCKNLINVIKLCKSKYIMPLCDDNIPNKGFYNKLLKYLKENDLNELSFVPIPSIGSFKKKFFGVNKFAYVVSRGSVLSGVLMKTKNINFKYAKNNLYVHNYIYINYFLKYGFKQLDIKPGIKIIEYQKISEKINDRAGRKNDLAVLDKLKTIDIFYQNNHISFLKFFTSFLQIYSWSMNVKYSLHLEKKYHIEKIFFEEILKYKNKYILIFALILILLKSIFSKKFFFILSSYLKFLFKLK